MVVIGVKHLDKFFPASNHFKGTSGFYKGIEFCKPGVPYRSFNKHCVALAIVSLVHIYFDMRHLVIESKTAINITNVLNMQI